MSRQLIVFDLGGVIVPRLHTVHELSEIVSRHVHTHPDALMPASERAGERHPSPVQAQREPQPFDPLTFHTAYERYRESFSLSMGPQDYYTAVLRSCGVRPTPALIDQLRDEDAALSSTAGEQEERLLTLLARAGQPYAIFSNAPAPVMAAVRATGWGAGAAVTAFTPELRFTKPNHGAFRRFEQVAAGAGFAPQHLVYFAAEPPNVDAATNRGWEAHRWHSAAQARAQLTESLGLTAAT